VHLEGGSSHDVYSRYVAYTESVKRLQIYLEEELDEALARQALREGTSKAALIRKYVASQILRDEHPKDPLDELVGRYDEAPGSIGEVVYGPAEVKPA
jgi:hypothetical protein